MKCRTARSGPAPPFLSLADCVVVYHPGARERDAVDVGPERVRHDRLKERCPGVADGAGAAAASLLNSEKPPPRLPDAANPAARGSRGLSSSRGPQPSSPPGLPQSGGVT